MNTRAAVVACEAGASAAGHGSFGVDMNPAKEALDKKRDASNQAFASMRSGESSRSVVL